MKFLYELVPILSLALHASAHGVLTAVTGANGVTGQGFGVLASTPRDGSRRNPFQQDTSIIRDREINRADTGVCGRTLAGGNNDVTSQLNAAVTAGLPSASEDGTVTMTLHQVNGDGAGPYTCEVSTDATGTSFAAMTVTTNVPGRNSRSNAKATDFALVAQMPAGTTCTGGTNGDACLVRCRNDAAAGPFGGCVAVTNAGSGNSTASSSATNATSATGAVSAAGSDAASSVDTAAGDAAGSATAVAASAATGTGVADDVDDEDEDEEEEDVATTGTSRTSQSKASKAGLARAVDEDEDDRSIHDAETALAADLDRRTAERIRRSRIFGRRTF